MTQVAAKGAKTLIQKPNIIAIGPQNWYSCYVIYPVGALIFTIQISKKKRS